MLGGEDPREHRPALTDQRHGERRPAGRRGVQSQPGLVVDDEQVGAAVLVPVTGPHDLLHRRPTAAQRRAGPEVTGAVGRVDMHGAGRVGCDHRWIPVHGLLHRRPRPHLQPALADLPRRCEPARAVAPVEHQPTVGEPGDQIQRTVAVPVDPALHTLGHQPALADLAGGGEPFPRRGGVEQQAAVGGNQHQVAEPVTVPVTRRDRAVGRPAPPDLVWRREVDVGVRAGRLVGDRQRGAARVSLTRGEHHRVGGAVRAGVGEAEGTGPADGRRGDPTAVHEDVNDRAG
ncbi:hypothetical protein [Ornithinimicrobium kibberense]|uniref:hypothetical protein n=1 Tax=Ornithinimicrobium kibberense TaxID=282060 RepID=UPI003615FBC2